MGAMEQVDLDLAFKLIEEDSGVEIVNTLGFGRLDQDVKEALRNVLNDYVEMLYEAGKIKAEVSK